MPEIKGLLQGLSVNPEKHGTHETKFADSRWPSGLPGMLLVISRYSGLKLRKL